MKTGTIYAGAWGTYWQVVKHEGPFVHLSAAIPENTRLRVQEMKNKIVHVMDFRDGINNGKWAKIK
tara:strand:+ start:266 stop:463 length:198 start_codon:yes stop_codon:yes gene_type:complete